MRAHSLCPAPRAAGPANMACHDAEDAAVSGFADFERYAELVRRRQVAPGRYEVKFPMTDMGSYLFKIRQARDGGNGPDETVADYTRAVTISYKPEYRHLSLMEIGQVFRPQSPLDLRIAGQCPSA